MSNKWKRMTVLLTAAVVFCLAGCGRTEQSQEETPVETAREELSVWTLWTNPYVSDPNELDGVKEMEERTGVHINWKLTSYEEASQNFDLMLASDTIPDIVYCFGVVSYPGGNDKAVEDGVFLETTQLVEEYMPHYQALRTRSRELEEDTMTDSGRLVAIYGINTSNAAPSREMEWSGLAVREDILEELELPLPETIDDWYTLLTAAREYGCTEPLVLSGNGTGITGSFLTAYGVMPEFYQEDGVIKYGPAEPGYRSWVELFRQWYQEDLINPDFALRQDTGLIDIIYTVTDRSVAFQSLYNYTADAYYLNGSTDNPDIWITAVPNPVLNAGDTSYAVQITSPLCGNETFISADAKDPALAARWLDYQFSEEGMLLNYYGIEGDTYVVEEDGKIRYTDKIMNHPDGYTAADAKSLYIRGNGCGLYNWESVALTVDNYEACSQAQKTWSAMDMSRNLPKRLSLTIEEGTEFDSLYTAIRNLVDEMTVKYIMGTESMESYDYFVEQLYDCGLERCIGIQQTALDRYQRRGE